MKIAFLGSRGIPARYSGFETFYEEISTRLVNRGHQVTVYNRSHFIKDIEKNYHGVKIISLPSIKSKHFDTITHTFLSTIHTLFNHYDIVYYCIVGNSPLVWIPRLLGAKSIINVDGEDWAREKWRGFAKKYQLWSEKIACIAANLVISDAKIIQERYINRYRHPTVFVPYGANIKQTGKIDRLKKWDLEPNEYILYVGRLVPENGIDILIRSYLNISTKKKLVIVGDAPYVDLYKQKLFDLSNNHSNIIFTGYAFGEDYTQLSSHAYIYVQPSGIDGTRPALLDQMGFGNCVIVRNSDANLEVIGDVGLVFDKICPVESLTRVLSETINNEKVVLSYREKVQLRIKNYYNWDYIAGFYEDLFYRMLKGDMEISYDNFLNHLGS